MIIRTPLGIAVDPNLPPPRSQVETEARLLAEYVVRFANDVKRMRSSWSPDDRVRFALSVFEASRIALRADVSLTPEIADDRLAEQHRAALVTLCERGRVAYNMRAIEYPLLFDSDLVAHVLAYAGHRQIRPEDRGSSLAIDMVQALQTRIVIDTVVQRAIDGLGSVADWVDEAATAFETVTPGAGHALRLAYSDAVAYHNDHMRGPAHAEDVNEIRALPITWPRCGT